MWHTSQGDRILVGEERRLFLDGLLSLVAFLEADDSFPVGVNVFDQLSGPEKLAVLDCVANALVHSDAPAPELTAVSEGAIGAVYAHISGMVGVEIEVRRSGDETRKQIIAAAREQEDDMSDFVPSLDSQDADEWQELIELLLDQIVWDRDWDSEWIKPDDSPEQARAIREFARIDDDYYSAVPPDPNPSQLAAARARLDALKSI